MKNEILHRSASKQRIKKKKSPVNRSRENKKVPTRTHPCNGYSYFRNYTREINERKQQHKIESAKWVIGYLRAY